MLILRTLAYEIVPKPPDKTYLAEENVNLNPCSTILTKLSILKYCVLFVLICLFQNAKYSCNKCKINMINANVSKVELILKKMCNFKMYL